MIKTYRETSPKYRAVQFDGKVSSMADIYRLLDDYGYKVVLRVGTTDTYDITDKHNRRETTFFKDYWVVVSHHGRVETFEPWLFKIRFEEVPE